MPRRATTNVTGIRGTGVVDYQQVFRVFECARPGCDALLKLGEDGWDSSETFPCPVCEFENYPSVILRSARFKYCRVCEQLQPISNFHAHRASSPSWRSGRQFECASCKNTRINPALNPLRTRDQHREAAERRRFYNLLSGDRRFDSTALYERFDGKCFKCQRPLERHSRKPDGFAIDHTLPALYLWPVGTGPTLLCHACNNEKHDKWPSQFYSALELRQLAVRTGIPLRTLSGEPAFNPEAVAELDRDIDQIIERWIGYPDEIKRLRRRILDLTAVDIYRNATIVPAELAEPVN